MRFFIQVLLLFFIVSVALSILRGAFSTSPQRQRRTPEEPRPRPASTSSRLVKDPVCGTFVPETSALRAGDAFFCSEECRGKYVEKGKGI
jgi:YHS domain-containing protein